MALPPAPPLRLRRGDREALASMVRKRTLPQRLAFRARIILACADGMPHREIKRQFHTTVDTVLLWRNRYREEGLAGLHDRPRPGRPPTFSPSATA